MCLAFLPLFYISFIRADGEDPCPEQQEKKVECTATGSQACDLYQGTDCNGKTHVVIYADSFKCVDQAGTKNRMCGVLYDKDGVVVTGKCTATYQCELTNNGCVKGKLVGNITTSALQTSILCPEPTTTTP